MAAVVIVVSAALYNAPDITATAHPLGARMADAGATDATPAEKTPVTSANPPATDRWTVISSAAARRLGQ